MVLLLSPHPCPLPACVLHASASALGRRRLARPMCLLPPVTPALGVPAVCTLVRNAYGHRGPDAGSPFHAWAGPPNPCDPPSLRLPRPSAFGKAERSATEPPPGVAVATPRADSTAPHRERDTHPRPSINKAIHRHPGLRFDLARLFMLLFCNEQGKAWRWGKTALAAARLGKQGL